MKTLRKFFNSVGKEVGAEDKSAVACHEIVVDEKGRVKSEANYQVGKRVAKEDK